MEKTKIFNIAIMVLNIILLAALIILIVQTVNVRKNAEPNALLPDSSDMPALGEGAAGEGAQLDAWIVNMKDLAQKHNVDAYFLQELFPENIVYKHRGEIIYADVNEGLAQHSYNWDYLAADENGIMRYEEPGGAETFSGIDVSKYQGNIDWDKVKDTGVDFAIVRAGFRGYGTGDIVMDEYFEAYMEGANKVEIPAGVYFFSQAITTEEAVEEADFLIEALKPYKVDYPIAFDMEDLYYEAEQYRSKHLTPTEITDIAIAFCQRVEEAGYTPMVYGNVAWMLAMMEMDRLQDYDLWFAQYRPMPFFPYEFTMWQYTHRGRIDGIEGDVDINISFKDYASGK